MRAWRSVEAQHVVSTSKLTDSPDEQALLEDLVDSAKPPAPTESEFGGLHVLLVAPFRYPPLPHGSRFGTRSERGIWYGSVAVRTALAEAAYYRLVFLEGSDAHLQPEVDLTVFRVQIRTRRGVHLGRPEFAAEAARIVARDRYVATQELGREMRAAGVEAFRYPSARDPEGGDNVGVFHPRAFGDRAPTAVEVWRCRAARTRVEFLRRDLLERDRLEFARDVFEVGGVLPTPAA